MKQVMRIVTTGLLLCFPLMIVGQQQQTPPMPDMPGMQHPMPPAPKPQKPTALPQTAPKNAVASQTGPAMTLQQLEDMSLRNNPTLAQAESEIRAAAGRARQAGLYPNPVVGYEMDEVSPGFPVNGGQHGFFVQQDIVLGGKLGLAKQVFQQERRQAEVEREEQRLRVTNGVRLLFYQALAAQQTVGVRNNLLRLANDAVATAHQLFNVGQADEPDVLQAEVEAEQAALSLSTAQQDQQRVWTELAASVGKPDLPVTRLDGNLEEIVEADPQQWLHSILTGSPAVKIASISVQRAEAELAQARREPVPNLQLRGGLRNNREIVEPAGRPIGWQGFAQIGVQLPIFNRNQGNIEAARAGVERARQEQLRVDLLLRERSAALFRNYLLARDAAERYHTQMIPRARKAYQLYLQKYQGMTAAYPQVLVSQRTLFQLQNDYIAALAALWTNSVMLRGFLLSDALEAPARAGEFDRPVREVNVPSPSSVTTPEGAQQQ